MDKIKIENLEIFAKHGVFPEENKLGQKFLVSADLYTDTRKQERRTALDASVDYGEICHFIETFMKEHTFSLIERIAERLAEELLLHIPGLEKVGLEVKKPWAPHRASAGIRIRGNPAAVAYGIYCPRLQYGGQEGISGSGSAGAGFPGKASCER